MPLSEKITILDKLEHGSRASSLDMSKVFMNQLFAISEMAGNKIRLCDWLLCAV